MTTIELTKAEHDKLTELSREFSASLNKITERRTAWRERIKKRTQDILQAIKKNCNLEDMVVEEVLLGQNLEGLNIGFYDCYSGLTVQVGNKPSPIKKIGGRLCFSQAYNGKIYVFIIFPEVEGYKKSHNPTKLLKTLEPSELKQEMIFNYFDVFMKEMVNWELEDREPIGFKQS